MTAALGETAQRRAEADEARRFLVTSIAHDLRTPLFALRGHLQAIGSRLGSPAVHLERAEARADALERLVGNLFAYTRDDYAQPAPRLEAVPRRRPARRGRGRPRAHDPPPRATPSTSTATRRSGVDRRPRPPQARPHQHPRQRAPLQPAGRPDRPQLGRHRRVDRPDHRPRRGTRNRPRPPPAHLRTRHPRNPRSGQPRRRSRTRPHDRKTPPRTPTRHDHGRQPTRRRHQSQPHAPTSISRRPALKTQRTGERGRSQHLEALLRRCFPGAAVRVAPGATAAHPQPGRADTPRGRHAPLTETTPSLLGQPSAAAG